MPRVNRKPEVTPLIIQAYANGRNMRAIERDYEIGERQVVKLAKAAGITPRPTGFASYEIAHPWVQKASKQFEEWHANQSK